MKHKSLPILWSYSSATRKPNTLFLAVLGLFAIQACQTKHRAVDEAIASNTLLRALPSEPTSLDPQLVYSNIDMGLVRSLYEGLLSVNIQTALPTPAAAKSYEISKNRKKYRFHLRPDAKWSNGSPLVAKHFLEAWKRALTKKTGSRTVSYLFPIRGAKAYYEGKLKSFDQVGVLATADHILEVTLERPTPYFLGLLCFPVSFPIHPHDTSLGNGPYILKSWDTNKQIVLQKNVHYHSAHEVQIETIHYQRVDSKAQEENLFRAGQLHLVSTIPPSKIDLYSNANPKVLHINPFFSSTFLRFNVTKAPFNDSNLRKAFSLALDRELLAKTIWKNIMRPAFQVVPPGIGHYPEAKKTAFNPALAKQIYSQLTHKPKMIEFLIPQDDVTRMMAETLQNMWKQTLGVNVDIQIQEQKVLSARTQKLDYQMGFLSWTADYTDATNFLDLFASNGLGLTGWSSKNYDELLEKAMNQEGNARIKTLESAEYLLLNEMVVAPLFFGAHVFLADPRLRGLMANPMAIFYNKHFSFEKLGL